ncbi:hypothetical protein GNZ12_25670 [Paraburkholderia sp. 1N]|uniref:YXWGXW repeat-containing protein n=1 Tax=Paraburkholderia solitsugae TaxID=2675748 RepID=A0ABX2BXA1_9BURK|nr:hypothetical protein [Paraburkholderia solitsugae]NPT44643.1 hypothetical protein [Paraburkholderia solitsugae]
MKYPLLASLVASLGIGLSGVANAVNVDVNIGTPAPVVAAPVVIQQGWHGDRYWDGHRYWERQEWEEHHHGAPVVVVQAPVVIGWHGDRYYDGHRYWERSEWEDHNHHHDDHGHCPPGHAKKGEC